MNVYTYTRDGLGETVFSDGPNFSNANALMILRSLGYGDEILDAYGLPEALEPGDLRGRLLTALAVGGTIADDGMPAVRHGKLTSCPTRPGYFASAYERILPVCETAQAWGTQVHIA